MKEAKVCPCCGTDIVIDEPILMNDFSMMGAGHPLFYKDRRVPLSAGQSLICWSLMKAYPGFVSDSALAERLGSETEEPHNLVKVYISRIRKIFADRGIPQPITTLHGHKAYQWDPRGGEDEETAGTI